MCTALPTPAPGAPYSRTGTVASATAATIFAGGSEAGEAAPTATAPAAVGGVMLHKPRLGLGVGVEERERVRGSGSVAVRNC